MSNGSATPKPGMWALCCELQALVFSRLTTRDLDRLSLVSIGVRSLVLGLLELDHFWRLRLEHLLECPVGVHPGLPYRHIFACVQFSYIVQAEYQKRACEQHGACVAADHASEIPILVRRLKEGDRVDSYRELLTSCHPTEKFNERLLSLACEYEQCDVIRLLLADDLIDPTLDNSSVLVEACREGKVKAVKLLLKDERADPGALNQRCMTVTCRARSTSENSDERIRLSRARAEVVRLLLADSRVTLEMRFAVDASHRGHNDDILAVLAADERMEALLARYEK